MGRFVDRIEELLAPPPTADRAGPLSSRIEELLTGPPPINFNAELGLEVVPPTTPPNLEGPPPTASTVPPTAQGLADWVRRYPEAVADLLGGGIGGVIGIGAGTPAGPAGQAFLGGLGATAGQIVARALSGQEAPTLGEGAMTTAAGAAGPAVAGAVRPITRLVTGATVGRAREVQQAVERAMVESMHATARSRGATSIGPAEIQAGLAGALRTGQETGREVARRVGPSTVGSASAGALTAAATGDLSTTGLVFLGLQGLSAARRAAAVRLLSTSTGRRWVMDTGAAFGTPGQAAISFAGLAASGVLSDDESEQARAISNALAERLDNPRRAENPRNPFDRVVFNVGRNARGRFFALPDNPDAESE